MKLSKSMIKCLEETKEEILENFPNRVELPYSITKKPTKKKTFLFFINLNMKNRVFFKLFINEREYKSYLYNFQTKNWSEE